VGFILNNINLHVKHSSSIAMIGMVGSRKSTFLSCILGEMEKFKGTEKESGNIALERGREFFLRDVDLVL